MSVLERVVNTGKAYGSAVSLQCELAADKEGQLPPNFLDKIAIALNSLNPQHLKE